MKIVKRRLPEGVRKVFEVKIGKKVKVLNSLYYGKDKIKKIINEEAATTVVEDVKKAA